MIRLEFERSPPTLRGAPGFTPLGQQQSLLIEKLGIFGGVLESLFYLLKIHYLGDCALRNFSSSSISWGVPSTIRMFKTGSTM